MRYSAALFAFMLAGCMNTPDVYAPPIQRRPMAGEMSPPIGHFVSVSDPNAERYFVRDVRILEANSYRWTGKNPTFRFLLQSTKNLKFLMEFSISGETMKVTGPLTMAVSVNGRLLDRVTYSEPGPKLFEKPVEESWLSEDSETIVSVEFDKVYIAEADGVQLGVTLSRAGFLE
jgi:hypothetical protein